MYTGQRQDKMYTGQKQETKTVFADRVIIYVENMIKSTKATRTDK